MFQKIGLGVMLSLLFLFSGCATVQSPVTGFLVTSVRGPITATAGQSYSKMGTATATSILGIIASGDASIDAAMKNGGVTKIHHVDFKANSFLGIVASYTTVVHGE